MTDKILVYSMCASVEEARAIARKLVEKRLAACVSVTPGVESVYRWKGAVEESAEVGLTIKTRRGLFGAVAEELRRAHSYEVPEIVAVPVVEGAADYLEWMEKALA